MSFWQGVLHRAAGWLGLKPGPQDSVQIVFEAFPGGGAGMLVALGLASLFLLGFLSMRRLAPGASCWARWGVGVLRGLVLVVPCLALLQPALISVRTNLRQGSVLVLADSSWSMQQRDPSRDASRAVELDRFLGDPNLAFLERLARKNALRLFTFDTETRPLEASERLWPGLQARGAASNLAGALGRILEEERAGRVAGVVLFTDGRWNEGGSPESQAQALKGREVPLFLVGVGDPTPRPILALESFTAPERAYLKDPFELQAQLMAPGQVGEIELTLYTRLAGDEERELERRRVAVPAGGGPLSATFRVLPGAPGVHRYRLAASAGSGAEGAQGLAVVEVDARPARVLLVAGGPSWEYRALRKLFTLDQTIELSCWLQSASRDFPQDGNKPIRALPTSEEDLRPYHAIVLVDPDPGGLDLLFSRNLARAVTDEGAGLAYIAGEVNSLDFFKGSLRTRVSGPIVDLLPAQPDQSVAEVLIGIGKVLQRPWPLEPTPEGLRDPLLALAERPARTRLLLAGLPGFHWNYPFRKPAPGAHVLAVHPGTDPLHRTLDGPRPLLAWHHAGAGRVLLSAIDETWRWKSVAEDEWAHFWVRALRFLAEERLSGDRSVWNLSTDRPRYEVGTEVLLLGRPPLGSTLERLEVTLTREGAKPVQVVLQAAAARAGILEGRFEPLQPGLYEALPGFGGLAPPARFEVTPPLQEGPGPMAAEALRRLAGQAGGRFLPLSEANSLPDRIEEATEIETTESRPRSLWDNAFFLGLAVLLLAAEWLLRKWMNLP